MDEKKIYVYENWSTSSPQLLGVLNVGKKKAWEQYSFEFSAQYLNKKITYFLDPALNLYAGRQYPTDEKLFGVFSDSCPDRWGRLLMKKRESFLAQKEQRKPRQLENSDYLLGVYDEGRMGALRFSLKENGPFLSSDDALATPPWVALRDLEAAARGFEGEDVSQQEKWLSMLLAPGSSLGGARPKATVKAPNGDLWIAKFPSKHDDIDVGAWEIVTHDLAEKCGLNVPQAKASRFSSEGTTFLVKRFDRKNGERLHFSSAMTMLGKQDNDHDASYLDLAEILRMSSSAPKEELLELWKRMVFNILVSNTDDHLRNHGFLLTNKGWKLAPVFDVNPNPAGHFLTLGITQEEYSLSLDAARECKIVCVKRNCAKPLYAPYWGNQQ